MIQGVFKRSTTLVVDIMLTKYTLLWLSNDGVHTCYHFYNIWKYDGNNDKGKNNTTC